MSRENVDLVLAFTAAYNARDVEGAVARCVAADVAVFPDAAVWPEANPRVGRDKFRGLLEESWSAWATCAHTPEEVRDIGDGRVLIRGAWGGTGTASGVETYRELSAIFTVREGQICKVEYIFDRDKADEAVGLRE